MTLGRAHARATVRAVAACARAGRAYPHESIPFYASLEPLFIGRVHISIGWLDRALQVDGASRIPGRNVDKSAPNVDKSAEVVHIRGAVRCGAVRSGSVHMWSARTTICGGRSSWMAYHRWYGRRSAPPRTVQRSRRPGDTLLLGWCAPPPADPPHADAGEELHAHESRGQEQHTGAGDHPLVWLGATE